jgi:hypothetical protein
MQSKSNHLLFAIWGCSEGYIEIQKRVFFGSMGVGLAIGLFLLRLLGKKFRNKWLLTLTNDELTFKYKNNINNISLSNVFEIHLNGGNEMRYVTFKTSSKSIRIRVGTNFLMPFSTKEDIACLDLFMHEISPILKSNFDVIDKTKALSPEGTIKLTYNKKIKS